jgi:hypothetical protein
MVSAVRIMKKTALSLYITALVAMSVSQLFAAADTRVVQAEFDRCGALMERVERSLRRYEDALHGFKLAPSQPTSGSNENTSQEVAALENRLEYFHNRLERAQGQADKIRDDLKNVSGPTCPSCIESSVTLYCRNGESLQTDIDEYLSKAADLQAKMGLQNAGNGHSPGKGFADRRAEVDSVYHAVRGKVDGCVDRAVTTLTGQAHLTLAKADSLHSAGNTDAAEKALDIAASLLEKAVNRCGTGK